MKGMTADRIESAYLAECLVALDIAFDIRASLNIRIRMYQQAVEAFNALHDTLMPQFEKCKAELNALQKGAEASEDYS